MNFSVRKIKHDFYIEKLREIGFEVKQMEGVLFYLKYDRDGINLEYLYSLTPNNSYLLERVKPYLLSLGEFSSEDCLFDAIDIDLKQFKNAKRSNNFGDFIEIDKEILSAVNIFEDLYLYYNLSKEDALSVKEKIIDFKQSLIEISKKSERVFKEKEPESFKQCD